MKYPSLTRSNMRYRGPMESRKLNKFYTDVFYNISDAYKRLEALKEETNTFYQDIRTGGNNMSSSIIAIRKEGTFLKGGEARE
jgi:hypothetical protein